jgi:hypothetical protein
MLTPNAPGAQVPSSQNVSITNGQSASNSIQAPTSSGAIWFSFTGAGILNVNFNGQNYPNVSPGQYTLSGLTTPLGLDVQVNGSVKLAWSQL